MPWNVKENFKRSEVAELLLWMLFKFSSVLYFSKYHDCKRRTEVLILFFVFSEDMSSLKVFISSSVYVTLDPGPSSVVASPSCLVELLLAIFCALFAGVFFFFAFSLSRTKEVFYASSRTCSLAQSKEEPSGSLWKTLLFVFGSWKGDNGFENIFKWQCRKNVLQLLCYNLTTVVM